MYVLCTMYPSLLKLYIRSHPLDLTGIISSVLSVGRTVSVRQLIIFSYSFNGGILRELHSILGGSDQKSGNLPQK